MAGERERRGGKARLGDPAASLSGSEVRVGVECVCQARGGSGPEDEDPGSTDCHLGEGGPGEKACLPLAGIGAVESGRLTRAGKRGGRMVHPKEKEKRPREGSGGKPRALLTTGLQVAMASALCKRRPWSPASTPPLRRGHSVS